MPKLTVFDEGESHERQTNLSGSVERHRRWRRPWIRTIECLEQSDGQHGTEIGSGRHRDQRAAFTKRLCELGFDVRTTPAKKFKKQLKLARSNLSDKKKFKQILRITRSSPNTPDPFGSMFEDTTIDPLTGALLGRYIAEERDSGRRLRAAYDLLSGAKEDAKLSESLEVLQQPR